MKAKMANKSYKENAVTTFKHLCWLLIKLKNHVNSPRTHITSTSHVSSIFCFVKTKAAAASSSSTIRTPHCTLHPRQKRSETTRRIFFSLTGQRVLTEKAVARADEGWLLEVRSMPMLSCSCTDRGWWATRKLQLQTLLQDTNGIPKQVWLVMAESIIAPICRDLDANQPHGIKILLTHSCSRKAPPSQDEKILVLSPSAELTSAPLFLSFFFVYYLFRESVGRFNFD